MSKSDPIDLSMQWYNYDRSRMPLSRDGRETSAQAFVRKMPPKGETAIDEQMVRSVMLCEVESHFLDPTACRKRSKCLLAEYAAT